MRHRGQAIGPLRGSKAPGKGCPGIPSLHPGKFVTPRAERLATWNQPRWASSVTRNSSTRSAGGTPAVQRPSRCGRITNVRYWGLGAHRQGGPECPQALCPLRRGTVPFRIRSAGVPPALLGAKIRSMATIRSRGRLPHWERDHATYFVTFPLADSLPQSVLQSFEFERRDIIATARAAHREPSTSEQKRLAELFTERIESKLDAGAGSCYLAKPAVAAVVAEALQHFHLSRYLLYAWCVMPNHVHILFRPLPGHALAEILHSWKSYSVREANRLLGRSGKFWRREYFDHIIRSEEEFYRTVGYILKNPQRAGLKDWRWMGTTLQT
jgi:REP element-mobilizing transposase RayT